MLGVKFMSNVWEINIQKKKKKKNWIAGKEL